MKRYYQMEVAGNEADIDIYGDITSWPWVDSDVSSANLSAQLADLDVDVINVNINSYGGEVAEGLAIYNALKRHKAKVRTCCDGFACSIASVVFMAGDERIMNEASLLMIHNAFSFAEGDANALRKMADDLDLVTSQSKKIYLANSNIDEAALTELMDKETFIDPKDALEMGFATSVVAISTDHPAQSALKTVFRRCPTTRTRPASQHLPRRSMWTTLATTTLPTRTMRTSQRTAMRAMSLPSMTTRTVKATPIAIPTMAHRAIPTPMATNQRAMSPMTGIAAKQSPKMTKQTMTRRRRPRRACESCSACLPANERKKTWQSRSEW